MTVARRLKRLAPLAFMFLSSGCLISDCSPVVGNECEASEDCFDSLDTRPNVCVPVDPDDPDGDLICAPAVVLTETTCSDVEDCHAAGFPIDADCDNDICTCETIDIDCDLTGGEFDAEQCGCVDNFGLKGEGEACDFPSECITPACSSGFCSQACIADNECSSGSCDEGFATCN